MDRHIGLAALIERVRAAGGEIDIASEPGNGTRVAVRIPRSAR
jgi:two-component system NarL family sensor kinase